MTTDETAAAEARTSNAPNQQDLQSTIAPQLTTAGSDPPNQPEIASASESSPQRSLPFIPMDITEAVSNLDQLDREQQWMLIDDLTELTNIARSFVIIPSENTARLYSKYKKVKFLINQEWIGHFIQPQQ
ncbi:hypothetical protein NPIL_31691 [Nephila pilipes]|uniref:Uncharacterized protein n=1 Tax=Nephila pilipes TaxID=299642 RepID=A0A8X6UKG8_NEPPI|nr:hypothetical protein NPIL_31691 [Nephila pilipes]